MDSSQGPTGRCFSTSGRIGFGFWKTFRVRVWYGSGWGMVRVGVLALHLYQLGIENLDRVFFGYILDKVFSFGSTKVLAALGMLF